MDHLREFYERHKHLAHLYRDPEWMGAPRDVHDDGTSRLARIFARTLHEAWVALEADLARDKGED
jgi:hypothetical protein